MEVSNIFPHCATLKDFLPLFSVDFTLIPHNNIRGAAESSMVTLDKLRRSSVEEELLTVVLLVVHSLSVNKRAFVEAGPQGKFAANSDRGCKKHMEEGGSSFMT